MLTWEELVTLQQVINNYMHDGKNTEQDVNILNQLVIRLMDKDDLTENKILEYIDVIKND